jgi:hypothetical protein
MHLPTTHHFQQNGTATAFIQLFTSAFRMHQLLLLLLFLDQLHYFLYTAAIIHLNSTTPI